MEDDSNSQSPCMILTLERLKLFTVNKSSENKKILRVVEMCYGVTSPVANAAEDENRLLLSLNSPIHLTSNVRI